MTEQRAASAAETARFFDDEHDRPSDAPLNAVLDLVESAVRTAVDFGLEAQLRARLARLLPPPKPEPDLFAAPAPPGVLTAQEVAEHELGLSCLIEDCARLSKLKASASAHAAIERMRTRARAELDASVKARRGNSK